MLYSSYVAKRRVVDSSKIWLLINIDEVTIGVIDVIVGKIYI